MIDSSIRFALMMSILLKWYQTCTFTPDYGIHHSYSLVLIMQYLNMPDTLPVARIMFKLQNSTPSQQWNIYIYIYIYMTTADSLSSWIDSHVSSRHHVAGFCHKRKFSNTSHALSPLEKVTWRQNASIGVEYHWSISDCKRYVCVIVGTVLWSLIKQIQLLIDIDSQGFMAMWSIVETEYIKYKSLNVNGDFKSQLTPVIPCCVA